MNKLSLIVLLAILVSCNSSEKKQEKTEVGGDTTSAALQQPITRIETVEIDSKQIPASIKHPGKFSGAWKWNDKNGENILVTSFTEPARGTKPGELGEELVSAELSAVHYLKNSTGYKTLWQITDHEKACGFDLTAAFIKGSISVTDLDKDDEAETWIQYKLACRSDVSPAYMKLIMHEGTRQHILQGNMWTRASEQDSFTVTEETVNLEKLPKKKDEYERLMQSFGRYESEKSFAGAPPAFIAYARKQWMKFVIESFE